MGRLYRADRVVFRPRRKGRIEFFHGQVRIARQHRAAAALDHEIPHGGIRQLGSLGVAATALIGDEMKGAAADGEVPLLRLGGAHPISGGWGNRSWRQRTSRGTSVGS